MDVEWDPGKAAANLDKHGVRFEEAATSQARWVLIGMSAQARLLTVVYTLRDEYRIRLISARKATRKEASFYA